MLPNTVCRFNVIPYQITNGIFHRSRRENEEITLPDFRQYYKATVIKTVYTSIDSKYRLMEQDRESGDKTTHLWIPYFWQRMQEYAMGQR